jgi:hypothetical protein
VRANSNLFWVIGAFFWIADGAYIVWSIAATGKPEWVGLVAMALTGVLGFFLAFYIGRTRAAQGGELPQDRPDANVDDGDPEMGQFSPWSWWPFTLGLGLTLVFLGLAIGTWVSFFGAPLAAIAIVGWNYEYYRNNFAR